jgi:hypothetical protein
MLVLLFCGVCIPFVSSMLQMLRDRVRRFFNASLVGRPYPARVAAARCTPNGGAAHARATK